MIRYLILVGIYIGCIFILILILKFIPKDSLSPALIGIFPIIVLGVTYIVANLVDRKLFRKDKTRKK